MHKGEICTSPSAPQADRGFRGHSILRAVGIHSFPRRSGWKTWKEDYLCNKINIAGWVLQQELWEEVRAPVGSAVKHMETSKHQECEGEPQMVLELGFI